MMCVMADGMIISFGFILELEFNGFILVIDLSINCILFPML